MSGVARLRHHLPLLAWLTLVWSLLWGTWSWANLLAGLLVGAAVLLLLPLPPVEGATRVHPGALLVLLGHFAVDLITSSAEVAWLAMRPRGGRHGDRLGAIVSVQLRSDSDLLLTLVALALSLVPGSLVLDLDRERRQIALHLLRVRDLADVDRQKTDVLAVEDRVVRAFGSPAEVAALNSSAEQPERTRS